MKRALAVVATVAVVLVSIWGYLQLNAMLTAMDQRISAISSDFNRLSQAIKDLESKVITVTVTKTVVAPGPATEVYERVKDSVVMIRATGLGWVSMGSGFVYDTEGHIVTNNHVIEGARYISVTFLDGTSFSASVVGADPYSDIAVLKVDTKGITLKPLRLGNSTELKIGEQVVAVGSPFGLAGSVTTGVVSQKGRLLETEWGYSIPSIIQFDAAVNPGNSGGPLLNMNAEVVGITTAIQSPTGSFVGIGYAIPSSIISRVVPSLISKGSYSHSWMGIRGINMDESIAEAMGVDVKRGVLITDVVKGGPADKAGLRGGTRDVNIGGTIVRIGGDIIIEVNGIPIRSFDELLSYMEERTSPGDVIRLTVVRSSQIIYVDVILGERPPPAQLQQ